MSVTKKRHHPLPLASYLLVQLLNVWCASLHWLCLIAPEAEPLISTFMIGGLFGLSLPPLCLLYVILKLLFGAKVWSALSAFMVWYFVSIFFDKSPKKPTGVGASEPSNFLERAAQEFWISHFRYNPTTVIFEDDDDKALKGERYVFAVHPHGIHCWPLNILSFRASPFHQKYKNMECAGLCASIMFMIPVIREAFLRMGYLDASRSVAEAALEKSSLFVCTGGEKEAMATQQGIDHVVLQNRKGFVRLALKKNADLVPVFGFNCSDLYTTYNLLSSFRNWLQKTFAIALPIFHGRFYGPLPYQIPVTVVIGKPIPLTRRPEGTNGEWPSDNDVNDAHAKYITALEHLHKTYAPAGRVLKII